MLKWATPYVFSGVLPILQPSAARSLIRLGNRTLSRGRSQDWPIAVLEVAFSEARAKLQTDVRYWLRASEGDVKIVFTIQIDHNVPKITIEK